MLQTMLWAPFSLKMSTSWHIIVRHYQMLSVITLLMTKNVLHCASLPPVETVIHTDHKPLQFMQTQGKLQNDRHQKWSTYLQQFHLNIKYKTKITNQVVDCLNRPPIATLTTMLESCGHETSGWPHLYEEDPEFSTTYQMLGANSVVANFHLQDGLLCHLGHLCIPLSERAKLIWEAHYSRVVGHFGIKKTVAVLHKHFY
jgi:hypothetical protein